MSAPEQAAAAPAASRRIHAPSSWPRAGMVALICAVVVTIIVLAFTWPTKTQEAKDLPITVAGPQEPAENSSTVRIRRRGPRRRRAADPPAGDGRGRRLLR